MVKKTTVPIYFKLLLILSLDQKKLIMLSMTMFLSVLTYISTKCFLLFAEATSWYHLGEIQACMVLALCELSIRCPIINCTRMGRFHDWSGESRNLCFRPNQILPLHTIHWTWMFVHLCRLHLLSSYLMGAYYVQGIELELCVGNKWNIISSLKELLL